MLSARLASVPTDNMPLCETTLPWSPASSTPAGTSSKSMPSDNHLACAPGARCGGAGGGEKSVFNILDGTVSLPLLLWSRKILSNGALSPSALSPLGPAPAAPCWRARSTSLPPPSQHNTMHYTQAGSNGLPSAPPSHCQITFFMRCPQAHFARRCFNRPTTATNGADHVTNP